MATLAESIAQLRSGSFGGTDIRAFFQDSLSPWYKGLMTIILAAVTLAYTLGQFADLPASTTIVLILWVVGLFLVIIGELTHSHISLSRWLRDHLFTSITNSLMTLLLVLFLVSIVNGLYGWAFARASFDPDLTAPDVRNREGAVWGVVWGAKKLLATGTLDTEVHGWRVWSSLWFVLGLSVVSFFAYRPPLRDRIKPLRRVLTVIWLLSPIILYILLAGVAKPESLVNPGTLIIGELLVLGAYGILWVAKVVAFAPASFAVWVLIWPALYIGLQLVGNTGRFPTINVDTWGGFLFTMIISAFAIIVSFPLGLALALGRRSQIRGIPGWIIWPVGLAVTIWGFGTSTPDLLKGGRGFLQTIVAFWPIVPFLFTLYLHFFKGNVVAAASTFYIEVVRGVPLITVLFMAIVLAPLFFPSDFNLKNAWAAMVGFTLFTAAYLAENVRGGLQSISKGQYEAADAIGLNTLQKMRFIILPQALRAVIPAIVGLFIGIFKDSSLVSVVGLFDMLGIINPIISNPNWLGLRRELYVFVAIIYFIGSFAMSSYSRRLETRLGVGER